MSTLYVFSDIDTEQTIATLAELRAALPAVPHIHSLYRLEAPDYSAIITIVYGSPDHDHHTVTVCTTDIAKETFDTVHKATEYFFAMAAQTF